jgi:hypothetical protein
MKRDVIEAGQDRDDEALLRDFEKSGSEAAFRGLVRRHLGMVLGAAIRRIVDRSLAGQKRMLGCPDREDIQTAFDIHDVDERR